MTKRERQIQETTLRLAGADPLPPPSVHPHESNQQPADRLLSEHPDEYGPEDVAFRHSGWATARFRVKRAMVEAGVHENRMLAFDSCGHGAFVMRSKEDPEVFRVRGANCCDRFCKPCARQRASIVAKNLMDQVQDRRIRFVTLTLKDQTSDLSLELDRLYESFQQLRRRDFWKKRVDGGAALLEVKYNQNSTRWHPHLHIMIEGAYLPQAQLKQNWLEITGDSYIVDVRPVHNNRNVIRYITKYATDPVDGSINRNIALLAEAIRAFKGRRTCMTFGTWRGMPLTKNDDQGEWELVGTLASVIWHANHGSDDDRNFAAHVLSGIWVFDPIAAKGDSNEPPARSPPNPTLFAVPF